MAVVVASTCLSIMTPRYERGEALEGLQLDGKFTHPDTSLQAAELELMVLRVALPLSVKLGDPSLVSFDGGSARLTPQQAAAVLSGLSKPVVCISSTMGDSTLLVDCNPVSTEDENNTYLSVMGAIAQHFGPEAERDKLRYVQVAGRGEARRFPLDAIRKWSREYVVPHTIGFGHWPAPMGLRSGEDVEEVLELLHIDDPKASDSFPEPWLQRQ